MEKLEFDLRDYFAGQVITRALIHRLSIVQKIKSLFIENIKADYYDKDALAKYAYQIADAMIKERNKTTV